MKKILVMCLLLSGCTASFQPYPSYSKQEIQGAFKQLDDKIVVLADAIVKLDAKSGGVKSAESKR